MTDIRQTAQDILDRCDDNTPRHHLAWAAGTVICDRAFYFAEFPILTSRLPGWGWPGCHGRIFNCERRGVHIWADASGRRDVVPPVAWAEIAALATLDRVGFPLHRRILDSLAGQEARQELPAGQRRPWHQVMDESQALARLVWQRCRPGVTRQLDMLDLIGASS